MRYMNKKEIFATILAGGKGERLWPKSRAAFPKQNLKLIGGNTIIRDVLKRARKIAAGGVFIITNKECFSNTKGRPEVFDKKRIIFEPFGRNTAPAIGLAALLAFRENKNSTLVIMPSDHLIGGEKKFFSAIDAAIRAANEEDAVVTLGIKPVSAESGYGYIGIKERVSTSSKKSYKVVDFIEKPRANLAKRLLSSGKFFWNSGIFIFKTSEMLNILKKHMPALYAGLLRLPDLEDRINFNNEIRKLYKRIKSESFDYAVMEKAKNIRVVPSDFRWSDIGSFESIARLAKKDKNGNIIIGNHVGIDSKGTIVLSERDCLVGTIGVGDLIIAATPDAVLVCNRSEIDKIRALVAKIKKKKSYLKFL